MSFIHNLEALLASLDNPLLSARSSWERVPLGLVARVENGAPFKSSLFGTTQGMPLIRIRDLERSSTVCLYDGPYDPAFVVQPSDLLVGMDGDFRTARWTGRPGLLNQRVCRLVVRPDCYDSRFLELVLQGYLVAIHTSTSSQTVTHLSSRTIEAIPLPLPPLAEQHRIVAKLDALLDDVDSARIRLAKIPTILRRFRKSVLAAACSGRLTRDWRRTHSDEDEQISVPGASRGEEATWDDDLYGELPEGWRAVYLEEILDEHTGAMRTGPFGTLLKKHEHVAEGVPVLGIENIKSLRFVPGSKIHVTSKKAAALADYDAQEGDVLITRSGTVGQVCVVPKLDSEVRISTNVVRLRLNITKCNSLFFAFCLTGSEAVVNQARQLTAGSTRDVLNQRILSSVLFPLPPIDEQEVVAKRVQHLLSVADAIEQRLLAATSRVGRSTQAILARAVCGELVTTEAELAGKEGRDYEPASALLERIRAAHTDGGSPKLMTGEVIGSPKAGPSHKGSRLVHGSRSRRTH